MKKIILLLLLLSFPLFSQTDKQKKHPMFLEYKKHFNSYSLAEQKKDYDIALKEAIETLSLAKIIFTENDLITSESYNNLGWVYFNRNEFKKAIDSFKKSLVIELNILGQDNPNLATTYFNIGTAYLKSNQEFNTAIEYFEKSLYIDLKNIGENNLTVANTYHNIGVANFFSGKYKRAIDSYNKSLQINLKNFRNKHPDVASIYFGLGQVYDALGDYNEAISYFEKSINISIENYGENYISLARPYNDIGNSYGSKGEYDKGIQYLEKSLKLFQNSIGNYNNDISSIYNNIGFIYNNKKEYNTAISYFEKSLSLRLKDYGYDSQFVGQSYSNLGTAYRAQGDISKAIEYLEKSLSIRIKSQGKDHPDVAITYSNLGEAYSSKHNLKKAINNYEESLAIRLKIFGNDHPSIAILFNNFGMTYYSFNEYNKSLEYFKQAITIFRKNPESKYEYIEAYNNLSECYAKIGKIDTQVQTLEELTELILKFRLELGKDKELFMERNKHVFEKLISIYISKNNIEKAFQVSEKMRGLSIVETFNLKFALKEANVKESDKNKILEAQENLQALYSQRTALLRNLSLNKNIEYEKYVEELWKEIVKKQNEIKYLEKKIIQENTRFNDLRKINIPEIVEFQKKFEKEKKTFIEYVLVRESDNRETLYAIAINGREYKNIKIEEDTDIERKIFNLRTIISTVPDEREFILIKRVSGKEYLFKNEDECNESKEAEKKTNLLWEQKTGQKSRNYDELNCKTLKSLGNEETDILLNALLKEIYLILFNPIIKSNMILDKSIVISSDGVLFTIPYAALKDNENNYLIENYQISLIPSATIWDKLNRQEYREYKYELFAMGNPIYAENHSDSVKEYKDKKPNISTRGFLNRYQFQFSIFGFIFKFNLFKLLSFIEQNKITRSINITTGFDEIENNMENLPGSIGELEEINKIVYHSNILFKEHFFQGIHANKDELFRKFENNKQNSDYRIAHFSVHGLFFNDAPELNALALTSRKNAMKYRKQALIEYENQYGELKRDGFLKLGETIDLGIKSDLVVMSACETSLGTYKAGEGLVGLPQGFLMGGANYVMATLWSVDDSGTLKFMENFYKRIFDKDNSNSQIPTLLQKTQIELLDKTKNKYYHDPYYWAPFVVYGR